MILFKVTTCPDKNQIGIYQHEDVQMSIGSGEADMVIDDSEISSTQVQISYDGERFSITNLNTYVSVKLNGADVAEDPVPLKSNDNINMGKTSIFITQINDRMVEPPEQHTNEAAEARLNKPDSVENTILHALEYLAKEGDAGVPPVPSGLRSPPPPPAPKK